MSRVNHNNPEPPDELLRCFDDNDVEVEPRTRRWLWDNKNTLHNGVGSVWVVNSLGEILCSRRSASLHGNPGKWQTYFGGKVPTGSTPKETAARELEEEIGTVVVPGDLFVIQESPRMGRYIIRRDAGAASLNFPDGEIVEVRWWKIDDALREQKLHPDGWCNGINPEQEEAIRRWMARGIPPRSLGGDAPNQ